MIEIQPGMKWEKGKYLELVNYLEKIGGIRYREYLTRNIKTKYPFLGIKTPVLSGISKIISESDIISFINIINDEYFEIVYIQGIMLSYISDYITFSKLFLEYVKKIDNTFLCDKVINNYQILGKNKNKTLKLVDKLIKNDNVFIARIGYVILLYYYLDKENLDMIYEYIKNNKREEFYINMVIAWLLSETYIKFPKETYVFIKSNKFNTNLLDKVINKIMGSYRVKEEDKKKLKELKSKVLHHF